MGFLDRFRRKPETRAISTSDSYAAAFGIRPTSSGAFVSPVLAENLSAVQACVNAVSSALASLPAYVYRRTAEGRIEQPDHPVARLLRRPNPIQTWPDFLEWLVSQTLLHGNGLARIEFDGAGRPTGLVPIPWGTVQVFRLPSGRLAYDVTSGTEAPRRYLDGEILHLKDRSDDGILGRSRISRSPEVLGSAAALQEWTGSMWRNGVTPSGALKFSQPLSEETFKRIRAQFTEGFAGPSAARKALILEAGAEWQSLSVSPEDAEVLASRRFTVEELARLFQVPGPIIGDNSHSTFTNSETLIRFFAQSTLSAWAKKIEAEFSRSVFTDPAVHLEIDLSGLLRGDPATRWQANVAAVQAGILDANEVRELEGFNPRPAATPNIGTVP